MITSIGSRMGFVSAYAFRRISRAGEIVVPFSISFWPVPVSIGEAIASPARRSLKGIETT